MNILNQIWIFKRHHEVSEVDDKKLGDSDMKNQ